VIRLLERLPQALRLAAFGALDAASQLRTPSKPAVSGGEPATGSRSLWLYVTTIGELNAVDPLVGPLLQALGQPPLTLITNHPHYVDAYLKKHPAARVEVMDGSATQVRALVKRCPPCMLVVAEIPCLLHDAPCRFSYATQRAARRAGAPAVLVNGWLYGYQPPSRMDRLERLLFDRDYVRGFDLMLVQTDEVRRRLLDVGADPGRVEVTGNLKFDAMRASSAGVSLGPLGQVVQAYAQGPVVVAGSVTETEDQRQMLEAFAALRVASPGARLVLAPRHPENVERMARLQGLLQDAGCGHQYRSQIDVQQALAEPVLVLDTMGELRDCYGAATFAYVGTDHNVLEPLSFGRDVYVSGAWEPTYPSYPVYQQMLRVGAIAAVDHIRDLGPLWVERMRDPQRALAGGARPRLDDLLAPSFGALRRDLAALRAKGLLPPEAG
jgi:3-deoxy-D-manno-octulosonic-acid transferase